MTMHYRNGNPLQNMNLAMLSQTLGSDEFVQRNHCPDGWRTLISNCPICGCEPAPEWRRPIGRNASKAKKWLTLAAIVCNPHPMELTPRLENEIHKLLKANADRTWERIWDMPWYLSQWDWAVNKFFDGPQTPHPATLKQRDEWEMEKNARAVHINFPPPESVKRVIM